MSIKQRAQEPLRKCGFVNMLYSVYQKELSAENVKKGSESISIFPCNKEKYKRNIFNPQEETPLEEASLAGTLTYLGKQSDLYTSFAQPASRPLTPAPRLPSPAPNSSLLTPISLSSPIPDSSPPTPQG